jgi:hypothetical protein
MQNPKVEQTIRSKMLAHESPGGLRRLAFVD